MTKDRNWKTTPEACSIGFRKNTAACVTHRGQDHGRSPVVSKLLAHQDAQRSTAQPAKDGTAPPIDHRSDDANPRARRFPRS